MRPRRMARATQPTPSSRVLRDGAGGPVRGAEPARILDADWSESATHEIEIQFLPGGHPRAITRSFVATSASPTDEGAGRPSLTRRRATRGGRVERRRTRREHGGGHDCWRARDGFLRARASARVVSRVTSRALCGALMPTWRFLARRTWPRRRPRDSSDARAGALAFARVSESDDASSAPAAPAADAATPPALPARREPSIPPSSPSPREGVNAALVGVDERLERRHARRSRGSPMVPTTLTPSLNPPAPPQPSRKRRWTSSSTSDPPAPPRLRRAARPSSLAATTTSPTTIEQHRAREAAEPHREHHLRLTRRRPAFPPRPFGGRVFRAPSGEQCAGAVTFWERAASRLRPDGGCSAAASRRSSSTRSRRPLSPSYTSRLQIHEAAHLLAHLMGIPEGTHDVEPGRARWPGCSTCRTSCSATGLPARGGAGKIGSGSLGRFSCVALAGISTEHVAHGFAEGVA